MGDLHTGANGLDLTWGQRKIHCLRRDAIPKVRLNEYETLVSQQPQTVSQLPASL